MFFSLEVKQAGKGDCLLLHFGDAAERRLMMIDGGPRNVYALSLKPRLLELAKLSDGSLIVEILMISHVDDDHIRGILDLTKEDRDAGTDGRPPLVRVLSLWHNSYGDLVGADTSNIVKITSDHLGEAGLEGFTSEEKIQEVIDLTVSSDEHVVEAGISVLASIPQGERLRDDASFLGWGHNVETDKKVIVAGLAPIQIHGLAITVVGPLPSELAALRKKHELWRAENMKRRDAAASELASYVDDSVTNLSSIVALISAGGRKILLTGDARGDRIIKGLEQDGVLTPSGSMDVDILKVPHHGSSNNHEADFFSRIQAKHYVFSGNGEHGNPERETFEMLFGARKKGGFTLHLTYAVAEIDNARKKEWRKQQLREKKRRSMDPKAAEPRTDWDHDRHSLAALFGKHLPDLVDVKIVERTKNHIIDLLDPVKY